MNRSLRLVGLVEAERLVDYYAQAYRMASLSHGRIELWEEGANWALESLEHREMADTYSPETNEMRGCSKLYSTLISVYRAWQSLRIFYLLSFKLLFEFYYNIVGVTSSLPFI